MEDVDLSRRLSQLGTFRVLPAEVITSSRRFEQGGVIRTLTRMTAFQAAYRLGVPADRLARWYAQVRSDANGRPRERPDRVSLSGLTFIDESGSEVSPADWRGSPVVLVFLRWLG